MDHKFQNVIILLVMIVLCGCGNLKTDGKISLKLEKIPFYLPIDDNQYITICDIRNSNILGYIWHWNNSYDFALMDQIFVWNMDTLEIEKMIDMDQEYLFSAVFGNDGDIYLSCADVMNDNGKKWNLLYLKGTETEFQSMKKGISTLESGWGSPWFAHLGNEIVFVCEEMAGSEYSQFESMIIKDDKMNELDVVKQDDDIRYMSYGIASGDKYFAYTVEKEGNLFLRVVNSNGDIKEFPWKNKGYYFAVVGDYLVQSGQGEKDGQNMIYVYDINTEESTNFRVKSQGFRMLEADGNSFYSVDSFYNVFYTRLENNRAEETFLELPQRLQDNNLRFLSDESGNIYFIYEDIPETEFSVEIYKAGIEEVE